LIKIYFIATAYKISIDIHASLHSKDDKEIESTSTYCSWYFLSLSIWIWHWELDVTF